MSKFSYLKKCFRDEGMKGVLEAVAFKYVITNPLEAAKSKVNSAIRSRYDNRVQYGTFAGMQLSTEIWWGRFDIASKILGTYESSVLRRLEENAQGADCFIDIGAADGYFAVGVLTSGLFPHAVAFEISERGRRMLARNAVNNGVVASLDIRAEATFEGLNHVVAEHQRPVILCDIEGGEFALLDEALLEKLTTCVMIIELHPMFFDDGRARVNALCERASAWFDAELFYSDDPAISQFRELDDFTDDERALAFSEGREGRGEWLLLTPRQSASA